MNPTINVVYAFAALTVAFAIILAFYNWQYPKTDSFKIGLGLIVFANYAATLFFLYRSDAFAAV